MIFLKYQVTKEYKILLPDNLDSRDFPYLISERVGKKPSLPIFGVYF